MTASVWAALGLTQPAPPSPQAVRATRRLRLRWVAEGWSSAAGGDCGVRSRGGSAPEAAGGTPGGSGRKGRKAASRDAGGSEASEAGPEGTARALREAPAVNSGDPTDGSGADGAADLDAADLEDEVGLEDVAGPA